MRKFSTYDEFDLYVDSTEFEEASDGITLLQEFVESADQSITRAEFAGVEFIEKADGTRVVYDVNTNTNYNSDVEAITKRSARLALARFLGAELEKVTEPALA